MREIISPLSGIRSPFGGRSLTSPFALFAFGEQGVWYDPSDLSTLFQDTAGTTPVTTPGQTVALALDKSKGLVLGPELVTNGTFDTNITGWSPLANASLSWQSGSLRVQRTDASGYPAAAQTISIVNGKTYRIVCNYTNPSNLVVFASFNGIDQNFGTASSGTINYLLTATGSTTQIQVGIRLNSGSVGQYIDFDNISVRELPGFHATQATSASRPTYGVVPATGRRNLLTFSEQFDNAAWQNTWVSVSANSAVAPDGTSTADTIVEDTSTGAHRVFQTVTIPAGAHTFSFYAKPAGRDWVYVYVNGGIETVFVNVSTGAIGVTVGSPTVSMTNVGNGWYRVSLSFSNVTTSSQAIQIWAASANNVTSHTGNGTSGILIWGAQLEIGSTATAYQRVGSSFDVTEAGVPSLHYLSFDGVDDFLITPTITPGIDKVQVFAGVRKLSDATVQSFVELSAAGDSNNGAFYLRTPESASKYGFLSRGTGNASAVYSGSLHSAPTTNVLTTLGDISGDNATLRINGVQSATSSANQGTGNFLAYPLYIGRRGGTALPFNGQLYSLIVRFGANLDAARITSTETWVNGKTRAY